MAEHEYYEVNGRQIRVRPTESGQEIDEYGNFHRQPNHFTKGFGEGENPVEADRYSYLVITSQTVTSVCIQHLQDLTTAIPEISDLAYTDW